MFEVDVREVIPPVDLPEGKRGNYVLERFSISTEDAAMYNARFLFSSAPGMEIVPGDYTRLKRYDADRDSYVVVMSDTISERKDHVPFVIQASGRVLVSGLGLGMCIKPLMDNLQVTHVTVVEKSEDVIALVAPTYRERWGDRLSIIHADAFLYEPPIRPNAVWHDIWDFIDDRNVAEMDFLESKYPDATWVGSWARDRCEQFEATVRGHAEDLLSIQEAVKRLWGL